MTTILPVSFDDVTGLLIADKVGEIQFLNVKNLDKLPQEGE